MYGDIVRETYCNFNGNVTQSVRKVTDVSNANNFYPIPVTPELLQKNGFKTTDNIYFKLQNLELEKIDIKHYRISINDGQDSIGHPFSAVHELQHILGIYGKPKDIKL